MKFLTLMFLGLCILAPSYARAEEDDAQISQTNNAGEEATVNQVGLGNGFCNQIFGNPMAGPGESIGGIKYECLGGKHNRQIFTSRASCSQVCEQKSE